MRTQTKSAYSAFDLNLIVFLLALLHLLPLPLIISGAALSMTVSALLISFVQPLLLKYFLQAEQYQYSILPLLEVVAAT